MRSAQLTLHEIIAVLRHRRRHFLIPAVIVTVLCAIGAFLLSNKYESTTTILVQRDEILNPLIGFEVAVAIASEDRLRTFNEIIYSRLTLRKLVDSLGLAHGQLSEGDEQALVDQVEKNIEIERRGSDSFRITYTDVDPARAKLGAETLSNLFIQTVLRVEGQRNERAVTFFETKLEEIRQKFESSQQLVVSRLRSRVDVMPEESIQLYTQVETYQHQIDELETKGKAYQHDLDILKTFPGAIKTDTGKQTLYDLQRADIPFVTEFRDLMAKYDDYSRKYKPMYPDLIKAEDQLLALLQRIQNAIEEELTKQQPKRDDLEKRRAQLVDRLKESSVSKHVEQGNESDYEIYRKLYDELKVKLEQAKTARDLGTGGTNQFIIIDPAAMPVKPSKPNRPQLIFAGFMIGLFFGIVTVILKEMLDTTIRTPRDVEVYQKPVIAFITDGRREGQE